MMTLEHAHYYRDRREAGRMLATRLRQHLTGHEPHELLVLALPRGGVPVGVEVARELNAPLDLIVVRKLGVPAHPEFAMGAIASGGAEILDRALISRLGLSALHVAAIADRELSELRRREALYRGHLPPVDLRGRVVVLVDDGLATGSTMRAAISVTRERGAARVIVAIPAGAAEACERLEGEVDALVCPFRPDPFYAVGLWYQDFNAVGDAEVRNLLAAAQRLTPALAPQA